MSNPKAQGLSYGKLCSRPFISLVNARATRFRIKDMNMPLERAMLYFKANEYLRIYDDIIPKEKRNNPNDVIDFLVAQRKISGKPYLFPICKEPEAHDAGIYYEFSPKQLEIINYEGKRGDNLFLEGSVRSSKTTAAAFLHAATYLLSDAGNHAIIGYSISQISRVAMKPLLSIIPWATKHQGNESIRLSIKSAICNETVEIYLVSGSNTLSSNRVLGTTLQSCWVEEVNTIFPDLLYILNDRMASAPRKRWVCTTNPINPKSTLIQWLKMFNHGAESTTETNGNFVYYHFTVHDNPSLTPEIIEDMRREMSTNNFIYTTRFLGLRAKPEGLVVSQFEEGKHVKDKLPTGIVRANCIIVVDEGFRDAFVGQFYIRYWQDGTPKAMLIAEYYHKEGVYCSHPTVSLGALSTQEHVKNICEMAGRIFNMLQTNYPNIPLEKEDILVDPAASGTINAFNEVLERNTFPWMSGFEARKANNNHAHAKEGKGSGVEFGFAELNKSFYLGRLTILKSPNYLGIVGFDTRKCVEELQSYSRDEKSGMVPLSGKFHYDSPHCCRYLNNMLRLHHWEDF